MSTTKPQLGSAEYEAYLQYHRDYRAARKEEIKARNKAYYKKNREKVYVARRDVILPRVKARYHSQVKPGRTAAEAKFRRLMEAVQNRRERQRL